jgi:hypothetical protein
MKVVFLDFDGVLNSYGFLKQQPHRMDRLDPEAVARLNRLLTRSGAKVVISSSWRVHHSLEELRKRLGEVGFAGEVIGQTPDISWEEYGDPFRGRAVEIQSWLDGQSEPLESFVVLDDLYLEELAQFLVKTEFEAGLGDEHVEAALAILGQT